jgi:hypothetical protein
MCTVQDGIPRLLYSMMPLPATGFLKKSVMIVSIIGMALGRSPGSFLNELQLLKADVSGNDANLSEVPCKEGKESERMASLSGSHTKQEFS